ncbi:MAG: hypothetical protein PHH28_04465 [Desulfuromonadaceae bacterium]|nr:hypothetical protein [Desulfuromonadaceae bacterium]
MKSTILKILIPMLAGSAVPVFAAVTRPVHGGGSMLIWFFIGFGVMVLLFQTTPAIVMFFSMLKGVFSRTSLETSLPSQKVRGGK